MTTSGTAPFGSDFRPGRSGCEFSFGSSTNLSGWAPTETKKGVHIVHTFRHGLARTAAGLARIPHVSATSQCSQGRESRSSPTSGTVNPLVRGGFCFNVCTFCLVRSL